MNIHIVVIYPLAVNNGAITRIPVDGSGAIDAHLSPGSCGCNSVGEPYFVEVGPRHRTGNGILNNPLCVLKTESLATGNVNSEGVSLGVIINYAMFLLVILFNFGV